MIAIEAALIDDLLESRTDQPRCSANKLCGFLQVLPWVELTADL
jgi:hypothetical protein